MEYHNSSMAISLAPGSHFFIYFSCPCQPLLHISRHAASSLNNLQRFFKCPLHEVQTPLPSLQETLWYVPPSLPSLTFSRHPTWLGIGKKVKSQFSIHTTCIPLLFCSHALFLSVDIFFPSFSHVNAHLISTIISCPDCPSNILIGIPTSSLVPLISFTEQPKWFC